MIGMVRAMAPDFADKGVRVNAMHTDCSLEF
jgi:NAD(P)-dependent dehydrogenase (short-subunit alcohol dehydrogenase family)